MSETANEFTVECEWCHREVISFVQPPAMVEVLVAPVWPKQLYRVCLECYAELIKFIASRSQDQ